MGEIHLRLRPHCIAGWLPDYFPDALQASDRWLFQKRFDATETEMVDKFILRADGLWLGNNFRVNKPRLSR